jgi:hypothetical protein
MECVDSYSLHYRPVRMDLIIEYKSLSLPHFLFFLHRSSFSRSLHNTQAPHIPRHSCIAYNIYIYTFLLGYLLYPSKPAFFLQKYQKPNSVQSCLVPLASSPKENNHENAKCCFPSRRLLQFSKRLKKKGCSASRSFSASSSPKSQIHPRMSTSPPLLPLRLFPWITKHTTYEGPRAERSR